MGLYKKVSDTYEAFRFTGDPDNPGWPEGWLLTHYEYHKSHGVNILILINRTSDNVARKGDWVVAGPRASFRTVKAEAFPEQYEPIVATESE